MIIDNGLPWTFCLQEYKNIDSKTSVNRVINPTLRIRTSLWKLNIKKSVYSFSKSIAVAMVKEMNMQLIWRDLAWNRFSSA